MAPGSARQLALPDRPHDPRAPRERGAAVGPLAADSARSTTTISIAYRKSDEATGNIVLTVVNLDPHHVQSGWVELELEALGIDPDRPYQVHDLLSEQRYQWRGGRNFVMLDPARLPAHVFVVRRYLRSEHDFDYFM